MNEPELDAAQHDLLARVAAGELAADASEVKAAMARAPRMRAVLDELLQAQVVLDSAGLHERQDLLAAETASPSGLRPDLVATTIARLAGVPGVAVESGSALRLARRRWVAYALVAAALLVLGWTLWRTPGSADPRPDDHRQLGGDKLAPEPPIGDLRSGLTLRWRAAPGTRFEVMVYDPQAPATAPPVLERDELPDTKTTWTIDSVQLQKVRPNYRWRVIARGRGGEVEMFDGALPP